MSGGTIRGGNNAAPARVSRLREAKNLTVPQMRRALVERRVKVPSKARRDEVLELYVTKVREGS